MTGKRAASSDKQVVKRQKTEKSEKTSTELIVSGTSAAETTGALTKTVSRTSKLQAPIMLLSGSRAEILSCKFSPDGQNIASGGKDKDILLWKVHGECENWNVLTGHKDAITEVQWSRDGEKVYSSSVDKTMALWDAESGERFRQFKGHHGIVNAISTSRNGEFVASASDDGTVRLWDHREKRPVKSFDQDFPMTAVEFSEDGNLVFGGGVDNVIRAWDIRRGTIVYGCKGHTDTITSLRTSPDGSFLLSNSMDNTLSIWDIKPFASASRFVKSFEGAPHGFEKYLLKPCWSPDENYIASGAADRSVVVWDVKTKEIKYKLPGHKGLVTEVDWSRKEPILLSSSTDKTMFLGELHV